MSSIDQKKIKQIARLAKIEILENEQEKFAQQVNSIINWVEALEEVNTDNIEPLTNVHNLKLNWHADLVTDGNKTDEILANATNVKYNYYTVPKVIE
jgi:aspartyl-tRNA(Asn)/glutamyl-tRNA(Gln) amidotransferase subunit C